MQPLTKDMLITDLEIFCDNGQCLEFYNLQTITIMGDNTNSINWSFKFSINKNLQQDDIIFRLAPLTDDAPVMLLFPGYGMHKSHMQVTALFFRHLGMLPVIMPGPTETKHFMFGINHAQMATKLLQQYHPERKVFTYGYSMGATAASHFALISPQWQAGIMVAPMRNFVDAGENLFTVMSQNGGWYSLFSTEQIANSLTAVQQNTGFTDDTLDFATLLAQKPLLVLASGKDAVAPYSTLDDIADPAFQLTEIPNRYHIELSYLWPEMRAVIQQWLTEQGVDISVHPEDEIQAD